MKFIIADIENTLWSEFFWPGVMNHYNETLGTNITQEGWENIILDYKASKDGGRDIVLEYYARNVEGVSVNDLTQISLGFIKENENKFFGYVIPFFKEARAKNYEIFFATAGPDFFAEAFKLFFESKGVNIAGYLCTIFKTDEHNIIEKQDNHIKIFPEKEIIAYFIKSMNPEHVIAMGDHKDDSAMMFPVSEIGGTPICVGPSNALREIAISENWNIFDPNSEENEKISKLLQK